MKYYLTLLLATFLRCRRKAFTFKNSGAPRNSAIFHTIFLTGFFCLRRWLSSRLLSRYQVRLLVLFIESTVYAMHSHTAFFLRIARSIARAEKSIQGQGYPYL